MGLLTNATNYTLGELTNIANVTNPTDFLVNVNTTIYSGLLYFILLWVLFIIIFISAQQKRDDAPLSNAMAGGAVCSILSVFMRAIGLLSDHQMWVFPIITILLIVVAWATKER